MSPFPLPVKAAINDEFSMPARIVQFGDRYKERSPDGLSRPREIWNVEVAFAGLTAGANLQAFLIEHGQHKPFQWQSPRDLTAQNYCILGKVGGSYRKGGGTKPHFFTRNMRFERVWDALVTPATGLPNISVVAVGSTGWTISRTGSLTSPLTVNYSIAVTPRGGTTTTAGDSIEILAGNSSAVFIPITNTGGSRIELLALVGGLGYTVGSPGSASISIEIVVMTVVANGVTGWNLIKSVASANIMINYSITSVINGLTTINNYLLNSASNSNNQFVSVSTSNEDRQETLTILTGTGYTLGNPSNETISILAPIVVASIAGGTEATGFTISLSTAKLVDTTINLYRFYFSGYTNFANEIITVVILAGSLSVNLPFGDRNTLAGFGRIDIYINAGSGYSPSSNASFASILFPS